jgi:hypothetical protein
MDVCFDKFVELITPFQALWNSARVTCIAVGAPAERRSVATRFVLREEELPKAEPYRKIVWLEPAPQVLITAIDFPKSTATQILFKAIDKYHVDLETGSTFDRVLIRWPLPGDSSAEAQPPRLAGFSWHEPHRWERPHARNQFGEDRTCLVLTGTGDYINTIMSDQLCRDLSSKLRRDPPHFDGIEGLYEKLLPGLRRGSSDQRTVQVIFPLPLDLEQAEDGAIALRAPKGAIEGQMKVVVNFKPAGQAAVIEVAHADTELSEDRQAALWHWPVAWPQGAESGKASLFYAGEEVSSIDLRRWAGAGTLRSAIDCYFDPDHEHLRQALFGENKKTGKEGGRSRAFEMAVVRLMVLLGIPLVWYGEGEFHRRNDAAGLVVEKQKRLVVLVECTIEKPETKFSALKGRAQELAQSLTGEAEVLPAVFTQVEPAESVYESAADHGIALVGRNEIKFLFGMLSATAQKEDPLDFLDQLRSLPPGTRLSLGGM